MAEEKSLHRMPVADCGCSRWLSVARSVPSNPLPSLVQACLREGDCKRIALDAVGRQWVFEVGSHSEVGVLESSPQLGITQKSPPRENLVY